MSTAVHCSSCGFENATGSLFCGSCGKSLTVKCRVCYVDNLNEAKYCRRCGAEIAAAPIGLPLDHAMAWRETFDKVGWQQWSAFNEYDWERVMTQGVPTNVDEKHEPWIFATSLSSSDYHPFDVEFGDSKSKRRAFDFWFADKEVQSHPLLERKYKKGEKRPWFVATRCRLSVLVPKCDLALTWWYRDISAFKIYPKKMRYSGIGLGMDGTVLAIVHSSGAYVALAFKVPSPGMFDYFAATTFSDPVSRAVGAERIAAKADSRRSFEELLTEFAKDIVVRIKQ